MARVLLVAGTWDDGAWLHPGSPFAQMLLDAGHTLVTDDPYQWTARLDGVIGPNVDWQEAGRALSWWLRLYAVDAVIGWSHGGTVALCGLAMLPREYPQIPSTLITVATPRRKELLETYRQARLRLTRWRHIRSDRMDLTQIWGSMSLGDWLRPWQWGWDRDMEFCDGNIYVPGVGHSGLLDPELWRRRDWASWITPPLKFLTPPTAPTPETALEPETTPGVPAATPEPPA